ncbi:helix-turn-helix domain-containing protein [Streptomyces sp. NPDC056084]|uniref:helix-turn-helix domain-containing protein n=1 Tax=unclassified Streptomyces TaxID=2593676 RepID=UPI0035DCE9FB
MCGDVPAIDEFLTAEQVAAKLKIHVTTVYRLASSGRLKAYRIGEGTTSPRGLRIPRQAYLNFLRSSEIAPIETEVA